MITYVITYSVLKVASNMNVFSDLITYVITYSVLKVTLIGR